MKFKLIRFDIDSINYLLIELKRIDNIVTSNYNSDNNL